MNVPLIMQTLKKLCISYGVQLLEKTPVLCVQNQESGVVILKEGGTPVLIPRFTRAGWNPYVASNGDAFILELTRELCAISANGRNSTQLSCV